MSTPRVLIYLLRRDLRLADNPIFNEISKIHSQSQSPFTHLLPLYVFPAQQVEVSGFLSSPSEKSPYPEARSQVGHYWRCGQLRAKFLAESVWDVKKSLEGIGSGLEIRVGMLQDVVKQLLEGFKDAEVTGLWMTSEEGAEEKREERAIRQAVEGKGKNFKLWTDEKYFVDDRDLPYKSAKQCPDVFTTFKKQVEPLREAPRKIVPTPKSLPSLPPSIPAQAPPFSIPASLNEIIENLKKPLGSNLDLKNPPKKPSNAHSAFPSIGGSKSGIERVSHLLSSGAMTTYKDTRNGLLGMDFSTKLSAWLALGCITARQVHWMLVEFEDGTTDLGKGAHGYGKGENKGTGWVRFELLWRDYMRQVTRKFGPRLFRPEGFRNDTQAQWSYDTTKLNRWLEGTTGTGLIDASQRELFLTGYTSNRARQNVASFLAKHLGLDWRLGAEWYECTLIDYDVSSNWGNWQYVAGVGNDPREGGGGRKFNPVKQADDYDPQADYIKTWCPETKELSAEEAFQYWKVPEEKREALGLTGNIGAEDPLIRIEYRVGKGNRGGYNGGGRGGNKGRGGGGGRGRGRGRGSGRDGFSKRDMQ